MKPLLMALALFLSAPAAAAELRVASADALAAAVAHARSGETIIVAAGRYDLTDLKIPRDLTLRGEDETVFYSSRPTAKGILNPLWDASLKVENIRFEGAQSPDLNGAGIRHDGRDLTVVNCVFEGNENGILATGQDTGVVTVAGSAFLGNGHGDGYSHGIYLSSGAALDIRASRFVGTRIGHHVKSLAASTTISASSFDDADGRTSYAVDASRGGDLIITGNSFIQAADADNATLFNYDLSRGGEAGRLVISGNRIVNRHRNGRLLRNGAGVIPVLNGNELVNEAGGTIKPD